jgi:hypothetical protein
VSIVTKKRVVLIPYWVQDILNRNKMPLADCLDIGKMKPVLALNDLLGMAALQNFFPTVLGSDFPDELWWVWQTSTADNAELKKFMDAYVTNLGNNPVYVNVVQSRLFDEDAKHFVYENPFITYDLSPETLGVVIYPGFFVGNDIVELQKSLIKAILKVLYVYDPSHEVAKTPLFKRYLELLAVK